MLTTTLKRASEQEWEESLVSVDNTKLTIHSRANYGDKSNSRSRRVLKQKSTRWKRACR